MDVLGQPTFEVRWFLSGTAPKAIEQWFQQADSTTREDWYLSLPKQGQLSIKLRQGKIEVKQRVAKRELYKFAKGTKGWVEHWQKWSFPLEQAQDELQVSASDRWLKVKKQRFSRHYQVTTATVEPVETPESIDRGCTFELTQLWVDHQPWYSLGFEAFDQKHDLKVIQQTLIQVAQQVLGEFSFSTLKAKNSFSYPQWLKRLQNH